MTDALLRHTDDGGEIEFVNGQVTLADGLETAVYLSLFGGNENDDGTESTEHLQYWGNVEEPDEASRYRSATQAILHGLPATTGNLQRVREAVDNDLAWMLDEVASAVVAQVTMPGVNKAQVDVEIEINDERFKLSFQTQWPPSV